MIKKIKKEQEEGIDLGWMVSFSDVITLLITFFVLIIAMSSMDQKVLRKSFTYFSGAPGIYENLDKGSRQFVYFQKRYHLTLEDYKRYLYIINKYKLVETQAINVLKLEKIIGSKYGYIISGNDVILKIKGENIFIDYDIELSSKGLPFMEKFKKILNLYKGNVLIEIFSSNFPVKTDKIKNNVDLTIKRGIKIAKYLKEYGINSERLEIIGWGSKIIKKDLVKITLKDFLKI